MKVIYNRFIPFGTYHGLNLFGIVFVQRRWGKMEPYELNHEFIHTCQQWEMTYVLAEKAYYNISFEREAYANERNMEYLHERRLMAWTRYLKHS